MSEAGKTHQFVSFMSLHDTHVRSMKRQKRAFLPRQVNLLAEISLQYPKTSFHEAQICVSS